MKKILAVLLLFIVVGCEGTSGPVGPQGPPGPVGQGFEVEANFNASNNYSQIFSFPGNAEVLDTDVVLVYLLYEVDQQTGNDVWQQLPASFFFQDGAELQYGFDHTLADVRLFLQGDLNFDTLGPDYTQNQIFRVAILPVDYVQTNNINVKNMDEVMGVVGKNNFKKITLVGK